jgi:hypothetical protein
MPWKLEAQMIRATLRMSGTPKHLESTGCYFDGRIDDMIGAGNGQSKA